MSCSNGWMTDVGREEEAEIDGWQFYLSIHVPRFDLPPRRVPSLFFPA